MIVVCRGVWLTTIVVIGGSCATQPEAGRVSTPARSELRPVEVAPVGDNTDRSARSNLTASVASTTLAGSTRRSEAEASANASRLLGDGMRSFRLRRGARVYPEPDKSLDHIGYVSGYTRVAVRDKGAQTRRCQWLAIEPRGWICAHGKPSERSPSKTKHPVLWKRGYDGRVYRDEADVLAGGGYVPKRPPIPQRPWPRKYVKIGKKKFLRTFSGDLVPAHAVPRYWGDEFVGVNLDAPGAPKLPIAWSWNRHGWKKPVKVYAEPSWRAKLVRRAPLRTQFEVQEETKRWVRVGDDEWVAKRDLRIARQADPPPEVTGSDEIWIDVVIRQQTLVMYRGTKPILATLVSTGRYKFATPTGQWRITKKTAKASFNSPRPEVIRYSIQDVAWVMYIHGPYALHGSWWNRAFGKNTSLGCIDIPAADIRTIYETVSPRVPDGWWQVYSSEDEPGSIVRVRRY